MPKLPYMQFYVSDWTSDCQLAMCSLSTRGCWLELLCGMHSLDHCGVITGTADQLARVCRCSVVEFVQAVDELRSYRIGEITERNGVYTVVNRRMRREHEASGGAKTRQKRFQEAKKTRNKREINGGESESESEPENNQVPSLRSGTSPEPENSGTPGKRGDREKIFFEYEGDKKIHGITPEQLALWKENYPALDVEQELKKASSWLDANRKNRKKDVKRFLVNWLNRQQDRAPKAPGMQQNDNYSGSYRERLRKRIAELNEIPGE